MAASDLPPRMDYQIVDAIGPFFRRVSRQRVNWSKIPFADLPTEGEERAAFWAQLRADLERFATRVVQLGFNTATLDDVAHLIECPLYEPELRARCSILAEEFDKAIATLNGAGLQVMMTSDFLSVTPAIERKIGGDIEVGIEFFRDCLRRFFQRFPSVSGIILRVGESDGVDVKEALRSQLGARTAPEVNLLLRGILPEFEQAGKKLIFRTWTVGANVVGDLIWNSQRFHRALRKIDSSALIVSMKPGDSDFFRYLPFNPQFHRTKLPKIIELQARREYEGAGEYPSYTGWHFENLENALKDCENMVGLSVWCQTGGWHRFHRLTFIEGESVWVEANMRAAIDVIRKRRTANESLAEMFGLERAELAIKFFHKVEHIIRHLLYIPEYARQRLYFRRVRIPPLIHVYWDCILIVEPVREILRRLVPDQKAALKEAEEAFGHFPELIELGRQLGLPEDDLLFMRDSFEMLLLGRRYFFGPFTPELAQQIEEAKVRYKQAWPRDTRPRYRIKTSFAPTPMRLHSVKWALRAFLRRRPNYRTVLDRLVTLNLLSFIYRIAAIRHKKALPKILRKSAMGVDSVLR